MANKFRGVNQSLLHSKYMTTHGNWTAWPRGDGFWHYSEVSESDRVKSGWHAGYYVIIVILVYGMSIVMLIASHINRKHSKLLEDRQIDKYLKEFQVVKERSSRDSYRNLKKAIVAKLHRGGSGAGGADRSSNSSACQAGKSGGIYRCISKSVLPLTTLAFPSALSTVGASADDVRAMQTMSIASRETLQTLKEKSRNEACLCNLYVIEEFEGEQKPGRLQTEKATVRHINELSKYRCHRPIASPTGKGVGQLNQQSGQQRKCVTAEINIPPLLNCSDASSELAARHSPVGETDADLITVDQHDLSIDGKHHPAEIDQPQLQKNADQIHKQNSSSVKAGQFLGESLSVINPHKHITPVQMHSPKHYLPKSRSPGGARENQAYGASIGHHPDDVTSRSSYCSSVCSRNTNPVHISSV